MRNLILTKMAFNIRVRLILAFFILSKSFYALIPLNIFWMNTICWRVLLAIAASKAYLVSSFMNTLVKPICQALGFRPPSLLASSNILSHLAFMVISCGSSFLTLFPKIVLYLLMKSSISTLMANPCFLILIASSMPAHLSYLQTSYESKLLGENKELGLMHLT